MRRLKPWGLDEEWLKPGKVITDPIHGDVHVTRLEQAVIDSPPFQRLRRVRQLGTTHLVYPGATHTRFSHVLGTLRVAQDFLDAVEEQRSGLHGQPNDLFAQWREDTGPTIEGRDEFDRRVAEAVVLTRLGALVHDFGHVPFGHSIEDDLRILTQHDRNESRYRYLWRHLDREVRRVLESAELGSKWPLEESPIRLQDNLRSIILPKTVDPGNIELACAYPFVLDIVGNTICADLLDYLVRDHVFSGLPLALGRRFISAFYVTPREDPNTSERMVLQITRGAGERTDVITELLKHLRYRYELSERALVHHAKLAADAMVGKALDMWLDALWFEEAEHWQRHRAKANKANASSVPDMDSLRQGDASDALAALKSIWSPRTISGLDRRARYRIERELRWRGDDSFLAWLHEKAKAEGRSSHRAAPDSRKLAVAELTRDLLDRRLFKMVASAPRSKVAGGPERLYEKFGATEQRRERERDAAWYAGIEDGWKVVVWLPPPTMRLKPIDVLVYDGENVESFRDRERRTKGRRGDDIYTAHEDLWAISIFVHVSVRDSGQHKAVLARLSEKLGVRLSGRDLDYTDVPTRWPDRLAGLEACNNRPELLPKLDEMLRLRRREVMARRSEEEDLTHAQLVQAFRQIASQLADTS